MKKSELLAAIVAAASATAAAATATATATATSSSSTFTLAIKPPHQETRSSQAKEDSTKEKFAPKFDGLRFIETLITAHR